VINKVQETPHQELLLLRVDVKIILQSKKSAIIIVTAILNITWN